MSYRPVPGFAKALIARRKLGERIGLLVVGVHDWSAGLDLASRSGAARVVLDEAMMPHEVDWSCAVALDCLVVGDCDDRVFYAAVTMLYAAGAASIWAEFPDGVYRLERWQSMPWGFYAADGPIRPDRLGHALASHRVWGLLTRRGVYGTQFFDAARDASYAQIFGPLAEKAKAWVAGKSKPTAARAA